LRAVTEVPRRQSADKAAWVANKKERRPEYGDMEMQNMRFYEGRALQAAEMPAVPGKGRIRKGRIGILPFMPHLR
jgi:hypothetical protein